MKLEDVLKEKKPTILNRWFESILDTYPPETANLLRDRNNRFTNPVGFTIYEGLDGILDGLIKEAPFEETSSLLDDIIKIRAVQDFTASQAVAFIFHLKEIIREELHSLSDEQGTTNASIVSKIESQIDNLALISFDFYMESREKIYELKATEARSMVYRLIQRQNQLYGLQEQSSLTKTPKLG